MLFCFLQFLSIPVPLIIQKLLHWLCSHIFAHFAAAIHAVEGPLMHFGHHPVIEAVHVRDVAADVQVQLQNVGFETQKIM